MYQDRGDNRPFSTVRREPHRHLTLSHGPEATGEARRAVAGFCSQQGLGEEECFDLKLAVTEAVTNALKGSRHRHTVEVRLSAHEDAVEIEVVDRGVFSPLHAGLARGPDAEGGRGIALMIALVDDVAFERSDEGTRVRLRKRRRATRPPLRLVG
jgi:serine/threonine-protein kinase RsbW